MRPIKQPILRPDGTAFLPSKYELVVRWLTDNPGSTTRDVIDGLNLKPGQANGRLRQLRELHIVASARAETGGNEEGPLLWYATEVGHAALRS